MNGSLTYVIWNFNGVLQGSFHSADCLASQLDNNAWSLAKCPFSWAVCQWGQSQNVAENLSFWTLRIEQPVFDWTHFLSKSVFWSLPSVTMLGSMSSFQGDFAAAHDLLSVASHGLFSKVLCSSRFHGLLLHLVAAHLTLHHSVILGYLTFSSAGSRCALSLASVCSQAPRARGPCG